MGADALVPPSAGALHRALFEQGSSGRALQRGHAHHRYLQRSHTHHRKTAFFGLIPVISMTWLKSEERGVVDRRGRRTLAGCVEKRLPHSLAAQSPRKNRPETL